MSDKTFCPCGSEEIFQGCCGPLLQNKTQASSAEQLMRSRYTANVLKNVEYLLKTWHPEKRPSEINTQAIPDWTHLDIIRVERGEENDLEGTVEFKAKAVTFENIYTLHEVSSFVKDKRNWFYVGGEIKEASSSKFDPGSVLPGKAGRNDPCPCGSGKKFKKCCRT